jgi:hypothetical protein
MHFEQWVPHEMLQMNDYQLSDFINCHCYHAINLLCLMGKFYESEDDDACRRLLIMEYHAKMSHVNSACDPRIA